MLAVMVAAAEDFNRTRRAPVVMLKQKSPAAAWVTWVSYHVTPSATRSVRCNGRLRRQTCNVIVVAALALPTAVMNGMENVSTGFDVPPAPTAAAAQAFPWMPRG